MAKQLYDYWFVQFDFPNEEGKPYKSSGGAMVWNEKLKRNMPKEWCTMTIGEVENNIITGKTSSCADEDNFGGDIPFITIDDIRGNLFVFNSQRTLSTKGAESQTKKYLPSGSLSVSCIGTIGVMGFIAKLSQTNQQINSDLAASYIIYKNKIIRIMKENIIQAIVAEMQRELDCRQMARLKAVLTSELHNVEIIEKSDCATQQTQENEHLLNSFISAKKIEGCSDKTLAYYRNTIERLLVTLSLAICHITTTDIRTYLSNYQEEHRSSKVTIDNMRRIFSSFFAWLEDEDYIAKSPVRRIHKVKTDSLVKEVLSDEQLEQLRDSCSNKRDLALIDILSSTGIRVGELVKLNRDDIDFHERQCVVFGKGNKERIVYFNARTKLHLQQYLDERTDTNPALFVSLHAPYTRLTISGVEVRIRKLGQSLSMPKVHPHKFRRTLATMAIDKGMPIEQVQRLLGHVRIDTTLHYAIVNQNNVKLAHKKYLG